MGATMGKSSGNLLDSLPSTQGTLHVVMLGLDSAGKTTALYRLKFDQYLNTVPTIGFNCEKVRGAVGKAKGAHFLVWDVGGQEKLRPLWRSYTRCTDGIVFVVDSVDVERMEEAKMELMRTAKCPDNQGVPVLILANKQDLPGARDPKELEKLLGLHELSSLYPVLTTTISGDSGSGGGYIDVGTTRISSSSQQSHLIGGVVTAVDISSANTTSRGGGGDCGSSSKNSDVAVTPTLTTSLSSSKVIQQHHKSSASAYGGIASLTSSSTPNLHYQHHQQEQRPTLIHIPITISTTHEKIVASPIILTNLISLSSTTATTGTVSTEQMSNPITTIIHHQQQPFKGWYIQPACAITGEGLQEGLEALYEMILKKRKMNRSNKKKR